ncbi:hypothetical protein GWK47_015803 [Chionoecetes opilio]|uniref:Uncharacterized protein n=1 Tax=Chionoecetes opilio TaxID=41210 RepID=A0A8J4XYQ9_CHIOP|nr:hypothetical protein GWK47_015803 [Chionoecetes opilio]
MSRLQVLRIGPFASGVLSEPFLLRCLASSPPSPAVGLVSPQAPRPSRSGGCGLGPRRVRWGSFCLEGQSLHVRLRQGGLLEFGWHNRCGSSWLECS